MEPLGTCYEEKQHKYQEVQRALDFDWTGDVHDQESEVERMETSVRACYSEHGDTHIIHFFFLFGLNPYMPTHYK